jgi:hypothetical protein
VSLSDEWTGLADEWQVKNVQGRATTHGRRRERPAESAQALGDLNIVRVGGVS